MKKLLVFASVLIPFLTTAQININVQMPTSGLVQKEQLWNLVLINNKTDLLTVNLKMNLQDAVSGQVVMSAITGHLLLGKGVKIINDHDIQPIVYNYNAADFSGRFLPMGTYIACYQVFPDDEKGQPLGDDCVKFSIDPLSPPLLNSPADNSKIQTPYPQFTWMPPAPIDMFDRLSYSIIVSEVLPGQTATEAIQYNTPLYARNNIVQPMESYQTAMSKLDTGKLYAWQVTALNGLSYAAKTEVWTFKVSTEKKPQNPPINETYLLLQNDVTGTYQINGDILRVKYYSYNKERETPVLFMDESGKVIHQVKQKMLPGVNYFDFKITRHFHHGKIYKVSVTDADNKPYSLTFSIK